MPVKQVLWVLIAVTPCAASAGEPQTVSMPRQSVTWTMAPANAVNTGVRRAKKVIYEKTTGKIKLE
jgi:hypothetical protein